MPAPQTIVRELTPEEQTYICNGLVEGRSIKDLCLSLGITIYQYFAQTEKDPFFGKRIANARVNNAQVLSDELLHVTKGLTTLAEVSAAKVWSDNAKWVASKMDPSRFADNLNVNVNHQLDLSSVLLAADNRVKAIDSYQTKVIDAIPATSDIAEINEIPEVDIPAELKDMV